MWTGSNLTSLQSMLDTVKADATTIAVASLGIFAVIVGVGLVRKIVSHFSS